MIPKLHLFLVFLLFLPSFSSSKSDNASSFTPADNFLIDCGASQDIKLDDGRTFKSDSSSRSLLETNEEVQVSVDSVSSNVTLNSSASSTSLPLCRSARIFTSDSTYTLHINSFGWHWVRLYFYPLPHVKYDLTSAVFTVSADDFVLLHDFSVGDSSSLVFKEYVFNISTERLSIVFKPSKNSYAFVNAIEVVSAPDMLISDSASTLPAGNKFNGLFHYTYEVSYRLNVGGPILSPKNDTLSRTWLSDTIYNSFPEGAQNVSVSSSKIKYPTDTDENGANQLIAPPLVYASAEQMANSETVQQNFNLSWMMNVDPGFAYLIRLHFCDIVSKSLNDLYFNVYVNGLMGASALDLSSLTGALATPYFADFVVNSSSVTNDSITVQVGPVSGVQSGQANAILNGIEVIKMSHSTRRGFFPDDGMKRVNVLKVIAVAGLALGLIAMLLLAIVFLKWQKRPQDWKKQNSFSSWLLPIHAANNSTLLSSIKSSKSSNKSCSRRSSLFGSRKASKSVYSGYFTNVGLGRYFTFSELQNATHNFAEKAVIGVGGFGKVYIAELDDGTKTAVKRGNPSSQQGINEFQTEIQMLSKLRHRHLVSLIGFSDEQSEMILVYEYMENGPLRDHLYGTNKPSLTWKQRLEICIGAARGLHYLHTGASQGIIHRDVKTTNILLDENWVAKVSDFGLSKAASLDQGYVSTAVKGSFGYLDPEYFRKQQLTEKSDVYSFGVVLFEVLCARAVIDPKLPREQVSLAEWAMQWRRKGLIEKIVDPVIAGSINPKSLKKYVEAAEKCLSEYGVDRPGMGDVLWNLEYALQLQEAASEPQIPDDKSTNMIALENSRSVKIELGDSSVSMSDDSEVTGGSPMFSQIETFQGR
ncbi:Malectin/receptor-like protein kinase family protein [Euphorbia peplus]|nr:Malectin/receptor-like protein kinase family protein [Euphorbia peplus]